MTVPGAPRRGGTTAPDPRTPPAPVHRAKHGAPGPVVEGVGPGGAGDPRRGQGMSASVSSVAFSTLFLLNTQGSSSPVAHLDVWSL